MAPSNAELKDALNHPLRRQVLFGYLDGQFERASADEVAAGLGQGQGRVAYHLKALAIAGILDLGERAERPGSGPVYSFAARIEPEWLRLVLALSAEPAVRG